MKKYDVAIIGAGAGGLTCAFTAAGFGKKVILIDKEKPGGECTWSGCIPSKALINQAKKIKNVKENVTDFEYDSKNAMDFVKSVREKVYSHESPDVLEEAGIEFHKGRAAFMNSKVVKADGRKIAAKKYIICTGSSPVIPEIKGLRAISYLTNETVFELERLPESIIVLGGGPIGTELSQAMNRLGTKVDLVEMMDEILAREEESLVKPLKEKIKKEGVEIHTGSKAVEAREQKNGKVVLKIKKEGKEKTLKADSILVAVGRKPNIESLGLVKPGVKFSKKGIEVDSYLRTSNSKIYAVGDVTGPYNFSHMANVQGILATKNAFLPFKKKINYDHIAWVTFTDPELARAGMTEDEAREKYGDDIKIYEYDFNQLDRALTGGETIERIKLVLDKKDKILGISILAERAGELIGEAQLLKTLGISFSKTASVIHPYPTYSEVFSKIGKKVLVDNVLNNPFVKIFRKKKR